MGPRLSRPSAHGDIYLEAFTLRILLAGLGSSCVVFLGWHWVLRIPLGTLAPLVAVAYAFVRCRSIRIPLSEWGWRRGDAAWLEVCIGVLAGLVCMPLRYVPGKVSDLTDTGLIAGSLSTFALLQSALWAPITEETLFRGMLYRSLRDRWHWPIAVLVGAAVFAAIHFPSPHAVKALVGGILYALLREWRGSLLAPLAAHATYNLAVSLIHWS